MDSDMSQEVQSPPLKSLPLQSTQNLPAPLQPQSSTSQSIQPPLQSQPTGAPYVQTASQELPSLVPFDLSTYVYPSWQYMQYVPDRFPPQPGATQLNQPKKRGRPSKSELPRSENIKPRPILPYPTVLQPVISISNQTVLPVIGVTTPQCIETASGPSQTLLPHSNENESALPAPKRICLASPDGKRGDSENETDVIENSENRSPENQAVEEWTNECNKERRNRKDYSNEEIRALLCVMQDEGQALLDTKGDITAKAVWEEQIFPMYKNRCISDDIICRRDAHQLSDKWKKIKAKYNDRRKIRGTAGHEELEYWDIEEQLDLIFAQSQQRNLSFDINHTLKKQSKSSVIREQIVEAIREQFTKLVELEERKLEWWKEETRRKRQLYKQCKEMEREVYKQCKEKERELYKQFMEMVRKMFEREMNGEGKPEQVVKEAERNHET
ncbi:hypothetical protein BKA69DRAFT_1065489 [Paraphysoderma sedebokerense]|nr:hypothetical protein BKA69DRAFT_1065489 [Paraphysoderma sedebokerense]